MPEIRHRASARARRLTLRVSSEGQVSCTRPRGVALSEARAFAEAQGGWIAARLAALPPCVVVGPGASLPVEGRALVVTSAEVAGVVAQAGRLLVPRGEPGARVAAWLRDLARDRLAAACARHAGALGQTHGAIRLRDPRSRWGSCSPRGDLMFSWRLAMASPEVLSYVAAHEVAHLERMDHSPAFWRVVESLDPEWRDRRAWLRREGTALMRYEFGEVSEGPRRPLRAGGSGGLAPRSRHRSGTHPSPSGPRHHAQPLRW